MKIFSRIVMCFVISQCVGWVNTVDEDSYSPIIVLDPGLADSFGASLPKNVQYKRHFQEDISDDTDGDTAEKQDSDKSSEGEERQNFKAAVNAFLSEQQAGNHAELLGTNQEHYQSKVYPDLNRRFVPQYKYTEVPKNEKSGPNEIVPVRAPADLVLMVAKESAKLPPPHPEGVDVDPKKALRTGDYWNGVWKEEVNPDPPALRSRLQEKNLSGVRTKIRPGHEFYEVVKNLKKISSSPRFLYIINKSN